MLGKRITIRRGRPKPVPPEEGFVEPPHPSLPQHRNTPPTYEGHPEGLAVYRVMLNVNVEGYPARRGENLILPYTEEFWKDPCLMLLREID